MEPPPSPPPAALPEEVVEDILLRFSPTEPASLLRAALVCKPWCRLISGPRFRRRFRELHRTPPMLGCLCSTNFGDFRFVPTTAFCPPCAGRFHCEALDARQGRILGLRYVPTTAFWPPGTARFNWEALDARHGRVLGQRYDPEEEEGFVVWDPITDKQWGLPFPPRGHSFAAAVLCARTATGACDHLDCHGGPFLVVVLGLDQFNMFVCTYSSDVNAWSEPISTEYPEPESYGFIDVMNHPVLVGNTLYFGIRFTNFSLKYNLESCEMSLIRLPSSSSTYKWYNGQFYMLTTTEENVMGLITVDRLKLFMWLMEDALEVDARWTQSRVIDLEALLPDDGVFTSPKLVGVADGLGIVFLMVESALYTFDLKTSKVELYRYQDKGIKYIVPYMSFYTPELGAACAGEGASEGGSSA